MILHSLIFYFRENILEGGSQEHRVGFICWFCGSDRQFGEDSTTCAFSPVVFQWENTVVLPHLYLFSEYIGLNLFHLAVLV